MNTPEGLRETVEHVLNDAFRAGRDWPEDYEALKQGMVKELLRLFAKHLDTLKASLPNKHVEFITCEGGCCISEVEAEDGYNQALYDVHAVIDDFIKQTNGNKE